MTAGFTKAARPRLYEHLVTQILEYVERNELGTGSLLPPERDLAEQLGVSRATVAQALVALEVLGVIRVQHGTGAVLQYRPNAVTVLRSLREHRARLPEIVEARLGLELQIVELAAERRTEADLQRIDEALAFMRAEIDKGGRGERGDELFHRALTDAAHNSVLSQLMAFIGEMVLESRIESLGQEGRPEASLTAHRRIADAVRAGDPEAAVEEMRAHIRKVSDVELLKDEATA
jgi:GntR family transcriptional regulator, transcriptional repressor for pyruvate dehydrogenase complex